MVGRQAVAAAMAVRCVSAGALALALLLSSGGWGGSASGATARSPAASRTPDFFRVCKDQTYALCITASCFVFNNVAYCTCDIERGDSISLPFDYGRDRDVCTVNAEGRGNGYMVSTYSVSPSLLKPRGDTALYTCPAATSDGAYAQCDGALCFTSTRGQEFPGAKQPLGPGQIVCSCPIVVADPATARAGYQIPGPWPCQPGYFANCTSAKTNQLTGGTIYLGAPTGLARILGKELTGTVPPLNVCRQAPG